MTISRFTVRTLFISVLSGAFLLSSIIIPAVGISSSANASPLDQTYSTVSADSLPTVQVDGVVWDQTIVGNTVYAVGDFDTARPAGAAVGENEVTRHNALAYNIETGELLDWNPDLNAAAYTVKANSSGTRIFIGGSFTSVGGQGRYRLVQVTATSARVTGFSVGTNASVRSLALSDNVLYIGGSFTQVNNSSRTRVAAIDLDNDSGSLDPNFNVTITNHTVNALALRPNDQQLVIGGSFTTVNGSSDPGYGMAVVSTSDGSLTNTDVNAVVKNAGTNGGITSLSADASGIYATAFSYKLIGANLEGAFKLAWDSGKVIWMSDCHGDEYDLAVDGDVVYASGHTHTCENIGGWEEKSPIYYQYAVAYTNAAVDTISKNTEAFYNNFSGQPATGLLYFFPEFSRNTATTSSQATWTVETNGDYVIYGGEFKTVNGQPQQGLSRFAVHSKSTNAQGPRLSGAGWKASATSPASGSVVVTTSGNYDRDDDTLTYSLERDTAGNVVDSRKQTVDWWALGTLAFSDTGLAAGSTHRYRVTATDPDGNSAHTDWVNVTVTKDTSGSENDWNRAVLLDGAIDHWSFDQTSGLRYSNSIGSKDMRKWHVTMGGDSAIAQDGHSAAFSSSYLIPSYACSVGWITSDATYTVEAWMRTTSDKGGIIVGFRSGLGVSTRALYILPDGQLAAHAQSGRTVTSTGKYNDGQWHYVVLTLGGDGQSIYADGQLVANDPNTRVNEEYAGAWCAGNGSLSGVSPSPTSSGDSFTGDIDEVSIYPTALTDQEIADHYRLGVDGSLPTAENAAATTPAGAAEQATGNADTQEESDTTSGQISDDFERTATHGWNATDGEQSWTTVWGGSALSVNGHQGIISLQNPGSSAMVKLKQNDFAAQTTDLTFSVQDLPEGGSTYFSVLGRQNDAGSYRSKLIIDTDGSLTVQLTREVNGTETVLDSRTDVLKVSAGDDIHIKTQVSGTAPSQINTKVWLANAEEPQDWTLSTSDSTAGLQAEGSVALFSYLSAKATSAADLAIDDFVTTTN